MYLYLHLIFGLYLKIICKYNTIHINKLQRKSIAWHKLAQESGQNVFHTCVNIKQAALWKLVYSKAGQTLMESQWNFSIAIKAGIQWNVFEKNPTSSAV